MLNVPPSAASALTTFHVVVSAARRRSWCCPAGIVILAGRLDGRPGRDASSSNAAASTKILNVDPALRPLRAAVVDVVGGQVELGLAEAGAVGRSTAMALMAPVFGSTMSIAAARPAFMTGLSARPC